MAPSNILQLSCDALPMPAVWAGELIRHSNRQSVQSRDTAATFLVLHGQVGWAWRHDNSRKLIPLKLNYNTYNKELLVIVIVLKK